MRHFGIHAIATHLPPTVRRRQDWPQALVDQWTQRKSAELDRERTSDEQVDDVGQIVLRHMSRTRDDPFRGLQELHVMAEGTTADMEVLAAEMAIRRSGIDRGRIGVLLGSTNLPGFLLIPNAITVHKRLGLPKDVFVLQLESVCNAFQTQFSVAVDLLRSGRAEFALIIQSSGWSHLSGLEDPQSAWLGDGAAAALIGPVGSGYGLLGQAHDTDSSFDDGLVAGVPGARWWNGAVEVYINKPDVARGMVLATARSARPLAHTALRGAGLRVEDVQFFACHQGLSWLPGAVREAIGVGHARTLDSFPFAASVSGANIPLILDTAISRGELKSGDVVLSFSGQAGSAHSALVFRWGLSDSPP